SLSEINLVIQEVIASRYEGERQVNQVIQTAIVFARNIIASLAILWIVIMGIRMATTSDTGAIDEQKRGIFYAVIGLGAILLIERLVSLLYGTPGTPQETLAPSTEFNAEVYGIVSFIRAVVGMIAIFFIIKAGIMSILVQGDEDKI